MKIVFVRNDEMKDFEDKFKADGEYEDYEVACVAWQGNTALFVLKEKENVNL